MGIETGTWTGTIFTMTSKKSQQGDFYVCFTWTATPNGTSPSSVRITSTNDLPITSDLLREVPIGKMLKQDVKIQRKNGIRYEATMALITGPRSKDNPSPAFQLANISPMKTPRKSRTHKKDLNDVAGAWREAQLQPSFESTGKYVAQSLHISHSLARTRIRQCRQKGLIPPSTHGNAVLKPRAAKRKQIKKRRKK